MVVEQQRTRVKWKEKLSEACKVKNGVIENMHCPFPYCFQYFIWIISWSGYGARIGNVYVHGWYWLCYIDIPNELWDAENAGYLFPIFYCYLIPIAQQQKKNCTVFSKK